MADKDCINRDYKALYMASLKKAERALTNVSDGLAHVTTGNVSHNIAGARSNADDWAKQFREEREKEEQISATA